MTIKDVIAGFGQNRRMVHRPRRPRQFRLVRTAQALLERMDKVGTLGIYDRYQVVELYQEALQRNAVADIDDRDIRRIADCIYHGVEPIAADSRSLGPLLMEVGRRENRRACRLLIQQYLRHFDPSDQSTIDIGRFVATAVEAWRLRPWCDRHADVLLFDPEAALESLSERVFEHRNVRRVMGAAGIRGDAFTAGIGLHLFRRACARIQARLTQNNSIEDVVLIIDWAAPSNDRLVYTHARKELADALLLPWQDTRRVVPDEIKRGTESFFDQTFGDPRLRHRENQRTSQNLWQGVSEVALQVRIRWLARQALDHFLAVVDATAGEQHQWEYRRAFWGAYIDPDYVSDAWVAFGSVGRSYARQLARDHDDVNFAEYANLHGSDPTQAVLFLQIGSLTIVDWSHNGRVRIWEKEDENAPAFAERRYEAQELRTPCAFEKVHVPPAGWQKDVHDFIRSRTRITIPHADYMP